MNSNEPIKIAINALGGQGGGVLTTWLVELGKRTGYMVQSTSVPGVAQRTGATVYYVEYFPEQLAQEAKQQPVMALMPTPGDVDVVLCSEIIEAGRAIDRGFVSDKTTLISSTHRDYAIGEKIGMGDDRVNTDIIYQAAEKCAGRFVTADFSKCVEQSGSIISSVIFGALAGSGAMPIQREDFEAIIVEGKRAVEANLRGFDAGYTAVQAPQGVVEETPAAFVLPEKAAKAVQPLLERLREMPTQVHEIGFLGLKKVVDHHDPKYGDLFLDRLGKVIALDSAANEFKLSNTVAKHLSLWMAYEDTIRVADLKTRGTRFERFRKDVRADDQQIVEVSEYLHPRVEEICDMLPAGLADKLLASKTARKMIAGIFSKGRKVKTTRLPGFLMMYCLSGLKFMRRSSYKYREENQRIENWLGLIDTYHAQDYVLAVEIAALQRLIKGYGDTHARGLKNFASIVDAIPSLTQQGNASAGLNALQQAALKTEDGSALESALSQVSDSGSAAA